MEATAISLGKAVLGGTLSYAKSKAAEEVALQLGVENDVVFITDELQMMQSFLMTADEERSQSKVLTTWVTQVRETAYNVEDSLMDFGLHAGKKPICGCIPRNLCDRRRIAKEVKNLRAKVEDVSNRNLRYHLIKDGSISKQAATADEQAASVGINQAMIAAVEQEKSKADLLKLVTAEEVDLRVMAVWGTTGDHGKTAAIHEVYDHPTVTSRYGFRAWVKLIRPFTPIEFLHSIVRQFFENDKFQEGEQVTNVGANVLLKMDKMNQSDLVRTFTAQLGNNSYLIVINDLRTIEEWLCIRRYFPDNKKQSRIIVSTQQAELCRLCTDQPYEMSEFKQLSYDQTLYLFHKKNSEERTNTASVSNFDKSQEAKPTDLEERSNDENNKKIYTTNEKEQTNTASVSNFDKSQEAKPAVLEERTNDENPKKSYATNEQERTNTASVSNFDKSQEAKPADLEERTNDENPKMVLPSSEPEPICDPATPTSEIQEYQLRKSTPGGNNFSTTTAVPTKKFDRTKTMVLDDEVLVGRMTEKSKVINLIGQPKDNQGCKVISVWGMGGIGKTTLVRSIYRSQQLGGWRRAWVTALRPFYPEVLIRTVVLQLLTDDPTAATETKKERKDLAAMRLDDLTKKLIQHLEEHESLIVLDDLSSTEEWNLIRDQLAKAKRIIVTTREYNVAIYCSGGYTNTHQLHVLQKNEAHDLFVKKVFKDQVEKCHLDPDMSDQASLIIKKCHGLPLAISTIGGFLATKPKTATEWRKVNDHIRVELDINPELRSIKTVLMRSYDGLPYHLKSAFLYMSIFPEDYKIKRKRLIRRWIAEGYCREMHGMTAEEVGDKDFAELLDRSMILLGEGEIQYDGTINSCQLHDLIREICILKAREENLVFTLEEGCCLSDVQGTIRHLVIGSNWKRDKDVLESMVDLSHVRSLTVFGDWKPFFISDKMRFLRVLDLGDTLGLRDHHLDQIGQLLHLRYLSIRGCRNIFSLPSSLGNLRHLQTLDGRGTNIVRFPSTITKLQKLERLLASGDDLGGRPEGEEDEIIAQLNEHEGSSYFSIRFCSHVLIDGLNCVTPYDMEDHLIDDTKVSYDDDIARIVQDAFLLWHREMSYSSRDSLLEDMENHLTNDTSRKNSCCTSSLYHIRMCLAQTLFRLSVCLFCWRPQALDDGLNWRDLFNMQSTFYALLFGGVEAPRGMRKLKALHTLGVVNVSRNKTTLKELKELTQLRKLGVAGVHSKYSKKFWSAISGLKQLRSLSVKGHGLDTCLGEDLLPPIHLESLKLEGKLVRVTEWILTLQNLLKLQLERTKIDSGVLIQTTIGQLPNLKVLYLRNRAFIAKELRFQGLCFPSLMLLEIRVRCPEVLVFEEHAMPKLEVIHLNDSWVEEMHGLAFLASLKEIRLGSRTDDDLKEKLQSELQKEGLKHVSLKLL